MHRKSHMLRSLVHHFLTRSRKVRHHGSGLNLAGGRRRHYRRVGGAIRRSRVHHVSHVVPHSQSFFSRHKKKLLSAAASTAALAGLIGSAVLRRRGIDVAAVARIASKVPQIIPEVVTQKGLGRRRRHVGGALRLAGQHGHFYGGPVHVGVSKMGLTNLPQAY